MTELSRDALQLLLDKSMKAKTGATLAFFVPENLSDSSLASGPTRFPVIWVTGMLRKEHRSFFLDREQQDFTMSWYWIDEHLDQSFYVCIAQFEAHTLGIAFNVRLLHKSLEHIGKRCHFFCLPYEELVKDQSYLSDSKKLAMRVTDKSNIILDLAFDESIGQELLQHVEVWKMTHKEEL